MKFFTEASPLRKVILGAGAVAFAAGVALIVVAIVSTSGGESEPDIEVRDLSSPTATRARTATPTDDATLTPAPDGPSPTPVFPENGYTLVIDKLNVNAPVQTFGLDNQSVPQVPTGTDAADIVAWYNFSAHPGTGSNAVFAGHVTWFGPGVFFSLTSIADGDQIKLVGSDGKELLYTVSDVFQVDATDPDSRQVMYGTEEDVITIITCDGDYVDTNDPIFGGEYSHRLVVRATLTENAVAAPAGG